MKTLMCHLTEMKHTTIHLLHFTQLKSQNTPLTTVNAFPRGVVLLHQLFTTRGMAVQEGTCFNRYINITADELLNVSCAMQNQKNHRPTSNQTKVSTIDIT